MAHVVVTSELIERRLDEKMRSQPISEELEFVDIVRVSVGWADMADLRNAGARETRAGASEMVMTHPKTRAHFWSRNSAPQWHGSGSLRGIAGEMHSLLASAGSGACFTIDTPVFSTTPPTMLALRSLLLSIAVATLALTASPVAAELEQEQATTIKIASRSQLNDATALANKNKLSSDNNVAIARSNVLATQNDDVVAAEADETEADGQMPDGMVLTGESDALPNPNSKEVPQEQRFVPNRRYYRARFFHSRFRGGYYGWRYPLPYWNRWGRGIYRHNCPFGRVIGNYFYC